MIGIGISTNGRKHLLDELLESIRKHTFRSDVKIYVADDTGRQQGVAVMKNKCLRALQDCEHIFLLDDDVKIIQDGWIENFINSGYEHLMYLNPLHVLMSSNDTCNFYHDCGGVFMYMRKSAVERVGAFNEKFDGYGFEHADYSIRILGNKHNYPCLKNTHEYIYAHDYSTANHKSSITDEDKQKFVKNNWNKFFNEPIKSIHLPL